MNNRGFLPVGLVFGFLIIFTIIDKSDFSGFSKGTNNMHTQSYNYLHKETVEKRVEVYESEEVAVSTSTFKKRLAALFKTEEAKKADETKNEDVGEAVGGPSAIAGLTGWYFPLDGEVYVTSMFADRSPAHWGIDLAYGGDSKSDAPVYAVNSGKVIKVGAEVLAGSGNVGRGNYVTIEHSIGMTKYYSSYAHMRDKPLVKVGDTVKVGQQVGILGKTGDPSGRMKRHLHLEVGIEDKLSGGVRPNAKKFMTSQAYSKAPSGWWFRLASEWSRLDARDFIDELKGTRSQSKVQRKANALPESQS